MRRWNLISAAAGLLLILVTLLAARVTPAAAQSGGPYDLTWNTIDGGGQMYSAGGAYMLGGTVGQPDAGVLEGDDYSLVGGFWGGASAVHRLYLPLLMRDA
jgi:hypothetical protein